MILLFEITFFIQALIVWKPSQSSQIFSSEKAEDCFEYKLPSGDNNRQNDLEITFCESVLIDVYPNPPSTNSTGEEENEDAMMSTLTTLPVPTNSSAEEEIEEKEEEAILTSAPFSPTTTISPEEDEVELTRTEEAPEEVKEELEEEGTTGNVPPPPLSSEERMTTWEATASIEDSRGNWCNMTISRSSMKVECSNGNSGVHSNYSQALFDTGRRTRFLLKINAEKPTPDGSSESPLSNMTNETEVKATDETLIEKSLIDSNKTTDIPLTSIGVAFAGQTDYPFLVDDLNMKGPLTLKWIDHSSELSVIYNCWDGCHVKQNKLPRVEGYRPFYLQQDKGFQGVRVFYTVLDGTSYNFTLLPSRFSYYRAKRWVKISIEQQSLSLKVFVGKNEQESLEHKGFHTITSMTVTLKAGGRITWCNRWQKVSLKQIMIIVLWVMAAINLAGIPIFLRLLFQSYLNLRAVQKEEGQGYGLQDLESQQLGVAENLQQAPSSVVLMSDSFQVPERTTRFQPTPTASLRQGSHESINSLYDEVTRRDNSNKRNSINVVNSLYVTYNPSVPTTKHDEDDLGRTSCVPILEADIVEDNLDLGSASSTDLPIAISRENNFDLDSTSSDDLPIAMRANVDLDSASKDCPPMTVDTEKVNPRSRISTQSILELGENLSVNIRKRFSQYSVLADNESDSSAGLSEITTTTENP